MGKSILVVDDKKLLRETIRDFLSEKDYNLIEAENGEKALEIFRNQDIDLVLLDYNLPGIDGLKTLQLMKKIKNNIPIIGLTGELSLEFRESFIKNGGYDIEAKSTIFERLIPVIEKALKGEEVLAQDFSGVDYEEIALELEKNHRWEESALYLKEAGIEQQALGNIKKAKEYFEKSVQNYLKAGRKSKANEVDSLLEKI